MRRKSIVLMGIFVMVAAMLSLQGAALAAPSWNDTGGGLSSSTVRTLAYDAARDLLYAGTTAGVWRCTSPYENPSWKKISAAGNIGSFTIPSVAYDAVRNVLYAAANSGTGTTDGKGIWISKNPNATTPTWSRITGAGNISNGLLYSIKCDPSSRNKLYAFRWDGVWRCATPSTAPDWGPGRVAGPPGAGYLEYDPVRNFLFFSVSTAAGGGVYISQSPNSPVFAFTALNGPGPGPRFEVPSMYYDTTRNILYAGSWTNGLFRCKKPDSSASWSNIGNALGSNTANALALDAANNTLYAGLANNKGVYKSSNPSAASPAWSSMGTPVSGFTVRSLAWNPVHSLYAGTKDHGVWRYGEQQPEEQLYPTWYLAEGSDAWGFETYISIINPNTSAVTVKLTYMLSDGPNQQQTINMPKESRAIVFPAELLGAKDFSTKVTCLEGKTIAVDRTMEWTGEGAATPEDHCSVGVTAPAKRWYLPEGSSKWGFECWLLIQNPNATDASCTITYMIEGEEPKTITKSVPANSRKTFNMADDIGQKDASIKVEGNIPVIPERAMYRNNRREGHDSIGTTSPATNFYLAEGTSAYGFTTYVLIQNPNSTPTDVTLTYMTSTGAQPQAPFSMDPNSRKTIRVNDVLPNIDFSTQVHGTKPIIAERAMYWDNGTGEACHDSIGMNSPHTTFYLPDGGATPNVETWTLVQNPNSSPVTVRVKYLLPSPGAPVSFTKTVPARSRVTFNLAGGADYPGITGLAGIVVTCTTSGKKIMVERAMYGYNRGAGTDTIGGYTD